METKSKKQFIIDSLSELKEEIFHDILTMEGSENAASALEILIQRFGIASAGTQEIVNYSDEVSVLYINDEQSVTFSPEDTEAVKQYFWSISKDGYAYGMRYDDDLVRKSISMHTLILGDRFSEGLVVDHANGKRVDNRRSNLRHATQRQNSTNRGAASSSITGIKGVSELSNGKFMARISVDGHNEVIGYFDCPIEAKLAYDAEALLRFGAFNRFQELPEKFHWRFEHKDPEFIKLYDDMRRSYQQAVKVDSGVKLALVAT